MSGKELKAGIGLVPTPTSRTPRRVSHHPLLPIRELALLHQSLYQYSLLFSTPSRLVDSQSL